ncbi:unnamed protein product [Phyllotreta striolata]|uniref:Uncharacterized protein n=1 Tax=Phyllotreta striolata TaxID=444603 RepID=A0A9N9TVH8_PHYSR|nr:unnamed protein product [Phyllotreta striolata]
MDDTDNCASVEDLRNNKTCAFNLDYDSGYISHKSESNLDNFVRDGDVLSLVSDPIYISENALLEMPITYNNPNIRKEIEREIFEGTNVFNSPLLSSSASTSRVSPSSGSECSPELNYFGFASEESNVSPLIPYANQITVEADYLDNMQAQNQNGLVKNPVFNNITNTYATSDPLKKLTLVLSKSDKENSYIVKRKYKSLSPVPDDASNDPQDGCDEGNSERIVTNACLKCVNCNADIDEEDEERSNLISPKNINNSSYETMQLNPESFKPIENANCDANLLRERNATNSESSDSVRASDQNINKVVSETLNCMINNVHDREETINASVILSTPEKSYNSNNSALSPDLFSEDSPDKTYFEEIDPVKLIPQERYLLKKDETILKRTQNHLKGVLPPRSVTTIRISIDEMLSKLESNKKYFWDSSTSGGNISEDNSKSLLVSSSTENSKKMDFPDVLKHRALGLYHNRNKTSEEFEELCMKYGQRYVGAETLSSCTVFEMSALSPMKRRNTKSQWNSKSPGKRLSHLARRRITFSSSNLQSGSSFLAGSRARQILVDAKKMDLLNRRKSPRKTPRKNTPKKSPKTKTRTPSSSAKKKLAMRFRKMAGEMQKTSDSVSLAAKRTLFHSPDKCLPSTSAASTSAEDTRIKSKRALFSSPSKRSPLKNLGFKRSPVKRLDFGTEKKRKRMDSDSYEEVPSKFPKSQSECTLLNDSSTKMLSSRTRSDLSLHQTRQIKELTITHKKKLQLAIYEALRSQNVLPTHPKFKTLALNLGRLTRQLFLLTANDSVGVTEKLLRIARHHVIAIVKGKSPEEIYEEFLKQKSKNAKPQGYVAPESSAPETKPASSLRSSAGSKNIDRIKKAIDF